MKKETHRHIHHVFLDCVASIYLGLGLLAHCSQCHALY